MRSRRVIWMTAVLVLLCLLLSGCEENDTAQETAGGVQILDREVEDNNRTKSANVIALDHEYKGHLETARDVDWFKFSLPSPGRIVILFEHSFVSGDSKYLWEVTLTNAWGVSSLYRELISGQPVALKSPNIRLPAGVYYLRVKPAQQHTNAEYKLRVEYTPEGPEYEKEFNDSFAFATPIPLYTKITGNLYTPDDVDFYAVELREAGSLRVTFEHENLYNDYQYWEVEILDEKFPGWLTWISSSGRSTKVWNTAYSLLPGRYYIKVYPSDHSSNSGFSSRDYQLTVEIVIP